MVHVVIPSALTLTGVSQSSLLCQSCSGPPSDRLRDRSPFRDPGPRGQRGPRQAFLLQSTNKGSESMFPSSRIGTARSEYVVALFGRSSPRCCRLPAPIGEMDGQSVISGESFSSRRSLNRLRPGILKGLIGKGEYVGCLLRKSGFVLTCIEP